MERIRTWWAQLYDPDAAQRATPDGRQYFWDNLRFIAIALVVVGHFAITVSPKTQLASALTLSIYAFHMPLFAYVSGYFSKSFARGTRFRIERVLSLLVLYFLLKIAIYAETRWVLGNSDVVFKPFYDKGLPWYLFAMAVWLTAAYLLRDVKPGVVMGLSVVGALLVGYPLGLDSTFMATRVLTFGPFFMLGHYTRDEHLRGLLSSTKGPVAGVAVLAAVFAVAFVALPDLERFRGFLSGLHEYARLGFPAWGPAVRAGVMVVSLIMMAAMASLIPRCQLPFTVLGQRSLQIYFLHRLVYPLFERWQTAIPYRLDHPTRWTLIAIALGLIVTFVCSMRVFSAPFDRIMGMQFAWMQRNQSTATGRSKE